MSKPTEENAPEPETTAAAIVPEVIASVSTQRIPKTRRKDLTQPEIAKLIDMASKGVQQIDIAKQLGVKKSTVNKALKRFRPVFKHLPGVEDYRIGKAQILDAAAMTALQSLVSPAKHRKASLNQVAYTFDVLDKASNRAQGVTDGAGSTTFTQININIVGETEPG